MTATSDSSKPLVGLFVTCTVDLLRPQVGFASAKLIKDSGCRVTVPPQSCCGQLPWNNGLGKQARALALQVMEQFADVDYVVAPSGSCASMLKNHYPSLFSLPQEQQLARRFAEKVHELTCFLRDVMHYQPTINPHQTLAKNIVYHDSCAGLRELGIREQPRELLNHLGVGVADPEEKDVCCGFGGTFCVKFEDISNKMVTDKVRHIRDRNLPMLLGGDLGCLLNIAGRLQSEGEDNIEVRHVAELLAGMLDQPAIGRDK